jgi:hypothetical protein
MVLSIKKSSFQGKNGETVNLLVIIGFGIKKNVVIPSELAEQLPENIYSL